MHGENLGELADLQCSYIKWVKEIVHAHPYLKGHWVEIMSIIELKHRYKIMRMLELLDDSVNDGDKDGIFMALVNKAELEEHQD